MSHLTTLVKRYLDAFEDKKRDHYVANIIEYLYYYKDKGYVTDAEVEAIVELLEDRI